MKNLFAVAAVILTTNQPIMALAQMELIYVSSEGHQYRFSNNPDGAVLESLYPVARFTGTGAMTQVITGIETLYLGRDCDAFAKMLGNGTWSWANGGFVVELGAGRIGFPRQEIDANNDLRCAM
ncbi:hypothetical protein [Parasedimentitalea huanghaiensis]|uniref:Uncharacterized protein n=1 Tax=Parasedimentitalea huanghaiensis TaxID=2682100 RepID=A0A6L6WHF6_9RHOB|nr:hypothetical protein [Zongyanglinia huanghaiensis]MVO15477.1 hypothetical protein [Zongyanglinia huanghaiensis]